MSAVAAARRPVPPAVRRRRVLTSVANHAVAIALALAFLLPFVFIVATALMTNQQALSPNVWPRPFAWSNFSTVFHSFPFVRYTLNTVTYAVLATVGVLLSCTPVAYALSRLQWRGRQVAFLLVLSTLMLPPQGRLAPVGRRHRLGPGVGGHRAGVEVHHPAGAEQGDPQRRPAGAAHPLTPVSVTPWTNAFCAKKKITITGSMNSSDAAIWRFHSTPRERLVNCWRATASVHALGLLPAYSRGLKKSFQE